MLATLKQHDFDNQVEFIRFVGVSLTLKASHTSQSRSPSPSLPLFRADGLLLFAVLLLGVLGVVHHYVRLTSHPCRHHRHIYGHMAYHPLLATNTHRCHGVGKPQKVFSRGLTRRVA